MIIDYIWLIQLLQKLLHLFDPTKENDNHWEKHKCFEKKIDSLPCRRLAFVIFDVFGETNITLWLLHGKVINGGKHKFEIEELLGPVLINIFMVEDNHAHVQLIFRFYQSQHRGMNTNDAVDMKNLGYWSAAVSSSKGALDVPQKRAQLASNLLHRSHQ